MNTNIKLLAYMYKERLKLIFSNFDISKYDIYYKNMLPLTVNGINQTIVNGIY
jgi:hypothetical protein